VTATVFDWVRLGQAAVAFLTPRERETAVVYLVRRIIAAGEPLPWPEGGGIALDEAAVLAFVDLEPGANWTHAARYLALGAGGALLRTLEVDRPPFLGGVPEDLVLVHVGAEAPGWAVATDRPLDR